MRAYLRPVVFALAALTCGILGAALYLEVQAYRTLKATYPQLIQVLQAHEAALQKLTGAPTFSLGTPDGQPPQTGQPAAPPASPAKP